MKVLETVIDTYVIDEKWDINFDGPGSSIKVDPEKVYKIVQIGDIYQLRKLNDCGIHYETLMFNHKNVVSFGTVKPGTRLAKLVEDFK